MLHYKIYGEHNDADWVVLFHGFGGNSIIWYAQIREYRKHFKVLAIDLPGHPPSPSIEGDLTIERCLSDIIHLLDELNIDRFHTVGISIGTLLVHALYNVMPERILSSVQGGCITSVNPLGNLIHLAGKCLRPFVSHHVLYTLVAYIFMPKKNHRMSRQLFIREAKKMKREDFLKWFHLGDELKGIYAKMKPNNVPKLYISGSEDYLFIRYLKKDISTDLLSSFHLIEDCGHVCNVEQAKTFNAVSIQFMKSHNK